MGEVSKNIKVEEIIIKNYFQIWMTYIANYTSKQDLYKKHYSKPYNSLIAQTFFKAGFVKSFGRGFEKIKKEFEAHNSPLPEVEIKIIELVR